MSKVLWARYTFYLCFAFPLNVMSVASGKRKNGVIRAGGVVWPERKTLNNAARQGRGWEPAPSGQDPDGTIGFVQQWRAVGN